ncbi:hypothetical protein CALVIDRAFT_537976 [Calocera viscosa TUFC12733]|uniref:Uncharacterized protein n=1 Tax=Calocera viscosa (strain TUFC12733) TaxID=1330018 RepID=A0A167LDU1_CALVF|nr:hypothetical protein CALVIDRAFT_537976 [Calocera viscosa TUFC12733]
MLSLLEGNAIMDIVNGGEPVQVGHSLHLLIELSRILHCRVCTSSCSVRNCLPRGQVA